MNQTQASETDSASHTPADGGPPLNTERAAGGAWIVGIVLLAAWAGGALALGFTLRAADFHDQILDAILSAWRPMALLGYSIAAGWLLLSGRPWARWPAAVGFAGGSAWILFFSALDQVPLALGLGAAVVYGLAGAALAGAPQVGPFLRHRKSRREHADDLLLGPLVSTADADRWLRTLKAWDRAGVLTERQWVRDTRAIARWLDRWGVAGDRSVEAVSKRLSAHLAATAPPPGRSSEAD